MAKIIPITEHFQHFLAEMKESFWGDLYGQTRQAWQKFLSCTRSGSATASRAGRGTSVDGGNDELTATATMSGIS